MKSFLLRLLGATLGLIVGSALLFALMPRARAREDRRRLEAEREKCQILLVGPSYANQVFPTDFNAEAKRIGLDKRLCKIARAGLAGYELVQELELALSKPWPKLELVLVDITLGRGPAFPEGNWFKGRTVEWHSLAGMKWLTAYYRDYPRQTPGFREWVAHAKHFFAYYASLGRAPELFGWREPLKVLAPPPQQESKQGGKKKTDASKKSTKEQTAAKGGKASKRARATAEPKDEKGRRGKGTGKRRENGKAGEEPKTVSVAPGTENLSRKQRRVLAKNAELIEWNQRHARTPMYGPSDWIHGLRRQIKAHGHRSFFVIAPVWYHPHPPADSVRKKNPLVVLRFNDPERFPELYVSEARGNTHHLSQVGRPTYSRLLANELLGRWGSR